MLELLGKIRPNVIVLASFITGLTVLLIIGTFTFLDSFVPDSPFWDGAVLGAVITLFITLIGVSIGGLVGVMSAVAQDAPPPTVPASLVSELVAASAPKCTCHKGNQG